MQGTEELRAMEVRLLQTYRIPGKEMGSLELVTAFIKIGTERLSIQRSDVMQEESGIRDDQGHFPGTLDLRLSSKASRPKEAQRCTLSSNLLRGMLAVSTSGTCPNKQSPGTITLHIVVHSVIGRHREELYTRIFPNRTVIVACNCAYTRFPYLEMQQNGISVCAMRNSTSGV